VEFDGGLTEGLGAVAPDIGHDLVVDVASELAKVFLDVPARVVSASRGSCAISSYKYVDVKNRGSRRIALNPRFACWIAPR
jgi:hypothetical protein